MMLAFDTNYVVRHLVQDDPKQCAEVAATLRGEAEQGRGVVLFDVVLCETLWVLHAAYQASRDDLLTALKVLQHDPVFIFEHPERVASAIRRFERGEADFPDCMILQNVSERGYELRTFDKRLKNAMKQMP